MKNLRRTIAGIVTMTLLITMLAIAPLTASAKNAEDYHLLSSTFNTKTVYNGPTEDASFNIDKDTMLQAVTTYHWNYGQGKAPGSISLLENGVKVGEWNATGRASSGVNNTLWDVFPDYVLKGGNYYTIVDSDNDTWSYNSDSYDIGFVEIRGYGIDSGTSGNGSSDGSSNTSSSTSYDFISSDWAKNEIIEAIGYGIVPTFLKTADLTAPIDRHDFAVMSLYAYEHMSGDKVVTGANPFLDTGDTEVVKAYNAGIIAGTSDTTFSPSDLLTREQAAAMLTRAYKKTIYSGWTLAGDDGFPLIYTSTGSFDDSYQISDYARGSVDFMASKGVISGMGDGTFAPQSSVTREQAIAIAVRMINKLDTAPQTPAAEATSTPTKEPLSDTMHVSASGEITTASGVTVDFSDSLDIGDNSIITVKSAGESYNSDMDTYYTAYDISLGNKHEFDGVFDIRIPYKTSHIESGQDPAKCIAGMYYNESTGEWEETSYEVDTAKKELVIHTDHLSRYGCFEFKNEGKRTMYVTSIHDDIVTDINKAVKALAEYKSNGGQAGPLCRELTKPYVEKFLVDYTNSTGTVTTYAGNIINDIVNATNSSTLIDKYIGSQAVWKAFNNVGIGMAAATLALAYMDGDNKTDKEIMSMYKDAMYLMASVSGDAMLGTVGSAVWIIDIAITDMGEYAYNTVADREKACYRYYMEKENRYHGKPRTMPQWRKTLRQIALDAAKTPGTDIDSVIMDEIDRYCGEFWTLPETTIAEIYDDLGYRGDGIATGAMRDAITAEFKGELLDSLSSVMLRVKDDLEYEIWKENQKRFDELKKAMNQVFTVNIKEDIPAGSKSYYAGYTAVFAPLNDGVDKNSWQVTLDSSGLKKVPVTWVGYMMAGQPNELQLYAPGKTPGTDKPEQTVPFTFDSNNTANIVLKGIKFDISMINGTWSDGSRTVTINVLNDTELNVNFDRYGETLFKYEYKYDETLEGSEYLPYNIDAHDPNAVDPDPISGAMFAMQLKVGITADQAYKLHCDMFNITGTNLDYVNSVMTKQ